MTTSSLTWITDAGSIGVFLENTTITKQFEATPGNLSNTVTYQLLNGNLPAGSTLSSSGLLSGVLSEVSADTTSVFTIRATEMSGSTTVTVRDRTFSAKVTGVTAPYFIAPAGLIFTTNDSVWQSFQVQYVNPDPLLSVNVEVVNGSLPPGLEINATGLIRGYADIPSGDSATYNFSLQISSVAGSSLPVQYSITVINQESLSGFIGRNPALLNTRPRSFTVSSTDPFHSYYMSSNSLGSYLQANNFIFKFIGYDFDSTTPEYSDTLTYDINGLESIGVINNQFTGWQNGALPNIGVDIKTYNVTARVFKTANTSLTSETFLFSITVVGNIDSDISWISVSNLGSINNGAISDMYVEAQNAESNLLYRMASATITSNLRTVVNTDLTNSAFGQASAYVIGNGNEWVSQPPITTLITYNFNTSLFDAVNSVTLLGGTDQNGFGIIGKLDSNTWITSPIATSNAINQIIFGNSLYVAIGNNGTIMTTSDYDSWSSTQSSTVTTNLNSVCWNGSNFIVVGDVGTILKSTDGISWNRITAVTKDGSSVTITENLSSVCYTLTSLIVVGSLGTILRSTDGGTSWVVVDIGVDVNFTSVVSNKLIPNLSVAVGQNGSIFRSTDGGALWVPVTNTLTTTTLYGIIYTNGHYITVGDAGTILVYSYDFDSGLDTVYSPTIDTLPPNLKLLSSGEIVGRLAFESADSNIPAGTSSTYTFSIQAYNPLISSINSTKQFTLTTYQEFETPYDDIYIQCYPTIADRSKIDLLLNGSSNITGTPIIPASYLYRPDDQYFGKAQSVIYQHMFGVPSVATDLFYEQYLAAISKNHYWRNVVLGEIKTAVARDSNNNIIYEVVYSEVIDNLINPQGVSIPKEITWPRAIKTDNSDWWTSTIELFTSNDELYTSLSSEYSRELFPNSLPNMRQQIADSIGLINNPGLLPGWMTSQQLDGNITGYVQAWVICYTKPGKSAEVKANIETIWEAEYGYNLNQINFQIDRFEVDRSLTYDYQGNATWSSLPSAQPLPDPLNSQDKFVYFTQKTILP